MPPKAATVYMDQVRDTLDGPQRSMFTSNTVAVLIQHGGFQVLIKPSKLMRRLQHSLSELEAAEAAIAMGCVADKFFQKLCPDVYYGIPSPLMSHLTFPRDGRTYTQPATDTMAEDTIDNPQIPAVFTFVGQFVDHDLTFNGLNLFDSQTNLTCKDETGRHDGVEHKPVPNFASPTIDLDSMYGRHYEKADDDPSLKALLKKEGAKHVFDGCRFRLTKLGKNAYDVPRWTDTRAKNRVGAAWIFDPRNDENQLILQIHILLMRVHNKLVDEMTGTTGPTHPTEPDQRQKPTVHDLKCIADVRKKVVCLWQSVLLYEFLPKICDEATLAKVLAPDYQFHYKPDAHGRLSMPHEFAIAYRFGHSMLRPKYHINGGPEIPLFDNRGFPTIDDLRGNRDLTLDHVIDWSKFYPEDTTMASKSLKIDSHVTSVVFDLPESAIPDDIKTEGNLPKRNLERSRSTEIGSGEEIARCLGVTDILTPEEIEPEATKQGLFKQDVNIYETENGKRELVVKEPFRGEKDTSFKTPLWYYVLREAELRASGEHLGPLGTTIVAEVIVQGIRHKEYAYNCADKEVLPGKKGKDIKLRDLINMVTEA